MHFFYSVQMNTVSKNRGFKWFTVLVSSLSRLKMDGSVELRFDVVRFTVSGKFYDLGAVQYALNNRLSSRTPTATMCVCRLHVADLTSPPVGGSTFVTSLSSTKSIGH